MQRLHEAYSKSLETIGDSYDGLYKNLWIDTPYEKYYKMTSKTKGTFGERQVKKILIAMGHTVTKPVNTGHDLIIDGSIKLEVKFSLASAPTLKNQKLIDPNSFMFQHIGQGKDWDKILFCGINPRPSNLHIRRNNSCPESWEECNIYVADKGDFIKHMSGYSFVFKNQQGGKYSGNDDYMVAGRNAFNSLISLPFVREYTGLESL